VNLGGKPWGIPDISSPLAYFAEVATKAEIGKD
jgi:hypothetical protein